MFIRFEMFFPSEVARVACQWSSITTNAAQMDLPLPCIEAQGRADLRRDGGVNDLQARVETLGDQERTRSDSTVQTEPA